MNTSPSPAVPAAPMPVVAPFGLRLGTGLAGVLVAAMMSGLNNRVGALALADLQGALGLDADAGHLLGSAYTAAETAAMPVAAWFAVTFSFRRFHLVVVATFLLIGTLIPLAPNYYWLLGLRALQGFLGGALIPLLMSAALRFLPADIRLHGLGLYALTATFSPNLATWLAALWLDDFVDWRLGYWQIAPAGLFALAAVWWGIPQDPVRLDRLKLLDGIGLICGTSGLALLSISLLEGERLDWLHSPLIAGGLLSGTSLIVAFLVRQWHHPLPFIRLQILERRNFALGFPVFIGLLALMFVGSALPANLLIHVQGFRPREIAPLGLIIALPQLVLSPAISALLYSKWLDARHVMAAGFLLLAAGCWLGSYVTAEWMAAQFWAAQICFAIGQPAVLVPLLFLMTSAATPQEGPFVSGLVNMLRSAATIAATVAVEQGMLLAAATSMRAMIDRAGLMGPGVGERITGFEAQATALSIAEIYRAAALFAVLLVIPTLRLQYFPSPRAPRKD